MIKFKFRATDVWQHFLSLLEMRREKEQNEPAALL